VGLILGPLAEQQLRRALAISQGDPAVLVSTPAALTLYAVAALALLVPIILRMRGKAGVLRQLNSDED
jgi:putative tricarboxylic transport membrane protein